MSGWVIIRRQPSSAVWGGIAGPVLPPAPVASGPFLGWVIIRRQPSSAVWGGIAGPVPVAAAGINGTVPPLLPRRRRPPGRVVWRGQAAPLPRAAAGLLMTGDYDGKTWWKKRRILRL